MNYENLTEKVRFPTRITTLGAERTRAAVYEPVSLAFCPRCPFSQSVGAFVLTQLIRAEQLD